MPNKFREELRRMASSQERLIAVSIEKPESYGWLRCPQLDQPGLAAWERPDGEIRGIEVESAVAPPRRPAQR